VARSYAGSDPINNTDPNGACTEHCYIDYAVLAVGFTLLLAPALQ